MVCTRSPIIRNLFFHLDGVTADLKGTISTEKKEAGTYMHVDTLDLQLNIKKVRMHIAKVFKNNRILSKF